MLRAAVVWEGVDRPLLVVRRNVRTPVTHLDWRGLTADEQVRALERHLAEDRERGIDLSAAPMARIAVARTSDTSVRVVRTSHHVLLDGWSTFRMLDELTAAYRALAAGEAPALPARRPFSAYVEWLERRTWRRRRRTGGPCWTGSASRRRCRTTAVPPPAAARSPRSAW